MLHITEFTWDASHIRNIKNMSAQAGISTSDPWTYRPLR